MSRPPPALRTCAGEYGMVFKVTMPVKNYFTVRK